MATRWAEGANFRSAAITRETVSDRCWRQRERLPATALASNTDFPVGYPSVVVQTNFATITNASRDESELFAADQKFCG